MYNCLVTGTDKQTVVVECVLHGVVIPCVLTCVALRKQRRYRGAFGSRTCVVLSSLNAGCLDAVGRVLQWSQHVCCVCCLRMRVCAQRCVCVPSDGRAVGPVVVLCVVRLPFVFARAGGLDAVGRVLQPPEAGPLHGDARAQRKALAMLIDLVHLDEQVASKCIDKGTRGLPVAVHVQHMHVRGRRYTYEGGDTHRDRGEYIRGRRYTYEAMSSSARTAQNPHSVVQSHV